MNDNYEKRVLINTNDLKWIEDEVKGVSKKLLSKINNQETAIIKIQENYKLNTNPKINSVEILVLEGTYINEYGEFKSGIYLRLSKEKESFVESGKMGCIIFRKTNHFTDKTQNIVIDTNNTLWLQGQGNLEVMPLFEQTTLVKWTKNEKFISHKHWGGEEIYVLNGIFMDEYGKYPKGTWIRSPHLSQHFPYVEDETIIFVKTGHL